MEHKKIDIEKWDRKTLFDFYENYDLPYIIMTANVDVGRALEFAHKNKVSFNLVMVFLANKVADSIINFRYRFSGRDAFEIEYNQPEINHIIPGTEHFVTASAIWPCDDILKFCKITHDKFKDLSEGSFVEAVCGKEDIINYTAIPWVEYTQMFRTINKSGQDNNPKISFGKYFEDQGKIKMPVTVQVHHALMDGIHVGRFYEGLSKGVKNLQL